MSDLIIKGMKMPKRCQACEFYYNDFSDGETSCLATGCEVSIGDHCDKGCPLVEIPTPHGRLIDADKLSVRILRAMNNGRFDSVIGMIDTAPTIIEAEE
ncbi:MAG: hypothetical protein IJH40_07225 [Ruminococcus sp.]|uniref:hypothetical protein n=1 Tax=Ruminococcus sp. TaxID=41978 RepID=UPI002872F56E|nr:hypothetical protein [Ruminococcus sp.]MBQ3285417.1 hypothetical protein [Ruminococcus sp.]